MEFPNESGDKFVMKNGEPVFQYTGSGEYDGLEISAYDALTCSMLCLSYIEALISSEPGPQMVMDVLKFLRNLCREGMGDSAVDFLCAASITFAMKMAETQGMSVDEVRTKVDNMINDSRNPGWKSPGVPERPNTLKDFLKFHKSEEDDGA